MWGTGRGGGYCHGGEQRKSTPWGKSRTKPDVEKGDKVDAKRE